jgi:hypothetical protein
MIHTITWFPIIPAGAAVERHDIPHSGTMQGPVQYFDLHVNDVLPQVKEEYMPPIASYSYRVLFNFTAEHTAAEWWKDEGKDWSKRLDSFANPNSELKQTTQKITAGATRLDEKLCKIYVAVMELENTHFGQTQGDNYKVNRTNRVANLDMDGKGEVTGDIKLSFEGAAAVRWRHAALTGDEESLKHGLRRHLESMVPRSL